MSSKTAGRV